jgi:hypothetical protein
MRIVDNADLIEVLKAYYYQAERGTLTEADYNQARVVLDEFIRRMSYDDFEISSDDWAYIDGEMRTAVFALAVASELEGLRLREALQQAPSLTAPLASAHRCNRLYRVTAFSRSPEMQVDIRTDPVASIQQAEQLERDLLSTPGVVDALVEELVTDRDRDRWVPLTPAKGGA